MRVLVIAQYFPPDMGGGATRAYNVAKGLSLVGCNVTVVTAFPHYPTGNIPARYRGKLLAVENEGRLRVVRTFVPRLASNGLVNRVLLFASFAVSSLFALPMVGKVDVVWAGNPNIIAVFPSLMYKAVNHSPVVQNVDDLWPEALCDLGMDSKSFMIRLGEFVAKVAYKLASAITPISQAYAKVITRKYGVESSKIRVVPAGVDLSIFLGKEQGIRSRDSPFKVLYIGAFSPAYDFDQVLKAARLLTDFNDIEFVIQGEGELASTLESKINETRLGNVKMVKKIVGREEVAAILHKADALLLPLNGVGSIEMGIASKLYEYQAAGKPIICCSSGQPKRYILETSSGVAVKPRYYDALAKAVIELKENPKLARMMGENGRKYVEHEASIEVIGLRMKEIFEAIIH